MATYKHIVRPDDILIHKRGVSHVTPHRYMLQSGNEKDCIDVAILAEGYTEKEMTMIVASTKNKYCPTAMRAWKIRFILFCFCC